LNYGYNQGNGNYPEPEEIISLDGNIIEIKRRDTYQSHSAGILFRIYRNIGIGLMAEFAKRKSNFLQANVDRTLIGAYLTYEF
jgi:hypothetical protein